MLTSHSREQLQQQLNPNFCEITKWSSNISNRPSDRRASNKNVESAMCVRHVSVSGALQFAVFRAVCCVLHRPASRVIHCSELQKIQHFFLSITHKTVPQKKRIPCLGPEGPLSNPGDLNSRSHYRRDSSTHRTSRR